jgi:deoxyhypusine monooxygenase
MIKGSVASDECMLVLKEYMLDQEEVVKESCAIGLDMLEYERSEELQYTI